MSRHIFNVFREGDSTSPLGKLEYIILFTFRYQLELKEEYIARTNKVTEDEKKNKGNELSQISKVAILSLELLLIGIEILLLLSSLSVQ